MNCILASKLNLEDIFLQNKDIFTKIVVDFIKFKFGKQKLSKKCIREKKNKF